MTAKLSKIMVLVAGVYPLVHPATAERFDAGEAKETDKDAWIDGQIAAGAMKEADKEEVAATHEQAVKELDQANQLLLDKEAAQAAAPDSVNAAENASPDENAIVAASQKVADSTPSGSTKSESKASESKTTGKK